MRVSVLEYNCASSPGFDSRPLDTPQGARTETCHSLTPCLPGFSPSAQNLTGANITPLPKHTDRDRVVIKSSSFFSNEKSFLDLISSNFCRCYVVFGKTIFRNFISKVLNLLPAFKDRVKVPNINPNLEILKRSFGI